MTTTYCSQMIGNNLTCISCISKHILSSCFACSPPHHIFASGPWLWSFLTVMLRHGFRPLSFEEHFQSVNGDTLKHTCMDFGTSRLTQASWSTDTCSPPCCGRERCACCRRHEEIREEDFYDLYDSHLSLYGQQILDPFFTYVAAARHKMSKCQTTTNTGEIVSLHFLSDRGVACLSRSCDSHSATRRFKHVLPDGIIVNVVIESFHWHISHSVTRTYEVHVACVMVYNMMVLDPFVAC